VDAPCLTLQHSTTGSDAPASRTCNNSIHDRRTTTGRAVYRCFSTIPSRVAPRCVTGATNATYRFLLRWPAVRARGEHLLAVVYSGIGFPPSSLLPISPTYRRLRAARATCETWTFPSYRCSPICPVAGLCHLSSRRRSVSSAVTRLRDSRTQRRAATPAVATRNTASPATYRRITTWRTLAGDIMVLTKRADVGHRQHLRARHAAPYSVSVSVNAACAIPFAVIPSYSTCVSYSTLRGLGRTYGVYQPPPGWRRTANLWRGGGGGGGGAWTALHSAIVEHAPSDTHALSPCCYRLRRLPTRC